MALIEQARSPLRALLRGVPRLARSVAGPGRRIHRKVSDRFARRRQDKSNTADAASCLGDAAGEGCGCLFEGILDGAFVVIVLAGIGWVVSNNHGA